MKFKLKNAYNVDDLKLNNKINMIKLFIINDHLILWLIKKKL